MVEKPDHCYSLTGKGGVGKSTMIVGLYQAALAQWADKSFQRRTTVEAVWKITAVKLSNQFRKWELKDMEENRKDDQPVAPPLVTPRKVLAALAAGFQPRFISGGDQQVHCAMALGVFGIDAECSHCRGFLLTII
jgi:hypothetical protein